MNIKSTIACALAATALMMTSCLSSNNDDQTQTETLNKALMFISDNGSMSQCKETSIQIEYNYTKLTMGVTVKNLTLPDGTVLPNAKFSDIKLIQNNTGWMIAESDGIRPEVEGFSSESIPMFSKVKIASINHLTELNGQMQVGYERAVMLQTGSCIVYITTPDAWSTGFTYVDRSTVPEPFKSAKPIYLVKIDTEKQLASIQVHNAVFAPQMENLGLVIEFRDMPYTTLPNGSIRISRSEEFDPYHDNAPNSKFPISNLTCTWDLFRGINLSFNCAAMGGNYSVRADMPFNYGINSGDKQ